MGLFVWTEDQDRPIALIEAVGNGYLVYRGLGVHLVRPSHVGTEFDD